MCKVPKTKYKYGLIELFFFCSEWSTLLKNGRETEGTVGVPIMKEGALVKVIND